MAWLSARALPVAALICLAGQGALLVAAGGASEDPHFPLPGLFLFLSILLVMVHALDWRHRRQLGGVALRILVMAALAVQVALALTQLPAVGLRATVGQDQIPPPKAEMILDRAELTLEQMLQEVDRLGGTVEARLARQPLTGALAFDVVGAIRSDWEQGPAAGIPLEAVIWQQDERIAWSHGAEPLPRPEAPWMRPDPEPEHRFLEAGRLGWILRDVTVLRNGLGAELQIFLSPSALDKAAPGVFLEAHSPGRALQLQRTQPQPSRILHLVPGDGEPVIRLTVPEGVPGGVRLAWFARLYLLALAAWVITLVGSTSLGKPGGSVGGLWLAALWLGRAVGAAVDAFRWVEPAFPGQPVPPEPRSWFSLFDPAYFATPFASGWFASVADAFLTAALLAVTAWWLLGRRRIRIAAADRESPRGGVAGDLVYGGAVGLALLALRVLSGLIAVNANARLVGTGVPLSSLSFWGLHLVLMVLALALASTAGFLVSFLARARRSFDGSGLAGGLAAAAGALLVTFVMPGLGWPLRLTAAALTLGIRLLSPGLLAKQQLLRRLTWPALLLLAAIWNHATLRGVYDQAERNWLEGKAAPSTEADEDWNRFLLGSVLEDMVLQESIDPVSADRTDIWRDERAWSLWRDSALSDLEYSCLVEILDGQGGEESLLALGFLRDFQYEVAQRSAWFGEDRLPIAEGSAMSFQTELRVYGGGEEHVMIGEAPRSGREGWIRVEIPIRSWRISTIKSQLAMGETGDGQNYSPRSEVDRPVLLLRGDAGGWLDAGGTAFPDESSDQAVAALKAGTVPWAEVMVDGKRWLCLWKPLPPDAARSPGEGILLGLLRVGPGAQLLDMSRLMLLDLVFLFLGFALVQIARIVGGSGPAGGLGSLWPGFQERFLGGYLLLGLFLLLVVGMSVDRVGHEGVREEARAQTRSGLSLAVEQLRSLLVEQARSLAGSEYIADLLLGQLAGRRPVGPHEFQQAMVFRSDGSLLLDETLSDLTDEQARLMLEAGRSAPFIVIRQAQELYVAAVIPIDLSDFLEPVDGSSPAENGEGVTDGFFLYRQRLNTGLIAGLADLVRGRVTLYNEGRPLLASHAQDFFSGQRALLAEPGLMASLLEHAGSPGIFAAPGRPFAFTGAMPLPSFGLDSQGEWRRRRIPAVLTVAFPDREREFTTQRQGTVLFLTGLANLILLTALALAGGMSWSIFRPLRQLSGATRALARGDFQAPLPEAGSDEVGRLAGAFGSMRNELHAARESLAARERFLATVLDRVPVGVAVLDGEGRQVVLNPAGRGILSAFASGGAEMPDLVDLRNRIIAATGARGAGELRSDDNRRTLRGAIAPLELPDGRTDTMLVFEDITEFLENKKMALNAELARQVAHEIKNPLTPIQLSAQLLGQAWEDRHRDLDRIVPETVGRILEQVALLRRIAAEFSLLGRPARLETEVLDLRSLTEGVVAAYAGGGDQKRGELAAPQVDLGRELPPPVLGHADSLCKILGNLMQNSLDATHPGRVPRIRISWRWDRGTVVLSWTDEGAGISPEVAEHLFDPYFSTKSMGTGLGLAICRNLIDGMGGAITLGNRPDGGGAVAELSLRRAQEGAPSPQDQEPPEDSA